jgi:shikimate dehydrogenase
LKEVTLEQSRPSISGKTQLFGLFADPVDHLQAPAVLNARFDRLRIDAVCVALHVTAENFEATVAGMRHLRNFAGYGVSIPHKTMAAQLCDELLPNAQACGVANVIRVEPDGRWIGETLDGLGMVKAISAQRVLDANTRVLQVGAGGVGRSIAVALALAGVGYLAIANRTVAKAVDLAKTVQLAAPTCVTEAGSTYDPGSFDIVINATSLGLNGQGPMPVEVSSISEKALVAEVVMVPELTPLLQAAQERGIDIVPGREMLIQQDVAGAEFFGMPV